MLDLSRKCQPADLNPLADNSADNAKAEPADERDPAAVELGRRGGLKGGRARAAKLTAEQRSEIARKAAASRWQRRTP